MLILREDDVRQVLTMPEAIDALAVAFRDWAEGHSQNIPRQRIVMREAGGVLHVLPAVVPELDALGFKAYTAFAGGVRFAVHLYRASTGELLALIEADWLGRMRTAAASGLATKLLARQDAHVLGMIGAGGQAKTQIQAIAAVRSLDRALVWSRDRAKLEDFCARMAQQTGVRVEPTATAEGAIRPADVVVTATTARDPVMQGDWLAAGTHVNAMGSNWANRREIDDSCVLRADLIVADSVAQAKIEAGDLIIPIDEGKLGWDRVHELRDVVAGALPGRQNAPQITLFKSLGIGLEDVAVAARIYALARERGLGQEVAFLP